MGPTQLLMAVMAIMVSPSVGQWLVSVDGTTGGNSPGRTCAFPFLYKGVSYNECITTDNKFVPWCATTSNYDAAAQWANCKITIVANRTKKGNAAKSSCDLPFTYKGRTYTTCTTDDYFSNKPWCATSDSYERDSQWAECVRFADIKTSGGNVPAGTSCVFPFIYRGDNVQGCITTNNQGVGWCSTSSDYDRDKLWGNCQVTTLSTNPGNPNCPNGNSYSREVNTLSYGGSGRAIATSVLSCQNECDRQANCIGFDYDYNSGVSPRCYIHSNPSNFNVKERQGIINVDQYTLTNRCTTSPGTGGPGSGVVTTRGGNAGRSNTCSFPFTYRGQSYVSCTSQNWYTPWCAVTPNYDRDTRWGECDNIATM